ncbi:MAG TPA: PAS domain-containing protein [Rhodocyclaceae bacterium]
MKRRSIAPTQIERPMREGDYIISSTDPKGRITAVNDILVEFSGYSREELIGAQHNILRHPDMPRAVFWLAWDAISNGEDFSGYIKNLAKDGSHYWVFAHIVPEYAGGAIKGYRSVRRCPKQSAVAKAATLYAEMLAAEHQAGPKDAIPAGLAVLSGLLAERRVSYAQLVAEL